MIKLCIKNQTDTIQKIIFDYDLIDIELTQHSINIERYLELSNQDIVSMAEQHEYISWDIFDSEPIIMNPHFHKGPEHRIILDGKVKFYLAINDLIYELDIGAGYGINIPDHQIHWFKSDNPFQAIRFFTNYTGHVKYNVPDNFYDR